MTHGQQIQTLRVFGLGLKQIAAQKDSQRDCQLAFRAEQKGRQLSQCIRGIYRGRHVPHLGLDLDDADNR